MEPTEDLTSDTVKYFQQRGIQATKVSDVIEGKDQAVNQVIQQGIDRANAKASSNAQRIQKWTIVGKDFSVSGGELGEYWVQDAINLFNSAAQVSNNLSFLGPTMKMRRPFVLKIYHSEIENFYKE